MPLIGDLPFVFLSFDEPWADEVWQDLEGKCPKAIRVHGVRGLNASHQAAAKAAGTDWLVTVDADTIVHASFFDVDVPEFMLQPAFRLDWPSRNKINGMVSGNGCLKLWHRELLAEMKSHEDAGGDAISLDHDIADIRPGESRRITMPGCHSETNPARTPFHGFRAGFREATLLSHYNDVLKAKGLTPDQLAIIEAGLKIWAAVGRHVENGLWVLFGTRLALWAREAWADWDLRKVNDYDWFRQLWRDRVLPRVGPGSARCPLTDVSWDPVRLEAEVRALGERVEALGPLGFGELDAFDSALVVDAALFATEHSGGSVDGVGHAFEKGLGVPRDISVARAAFEVATLLDHPAAVNNLARLHQRRMIGDADRGVADALFSWATHLGNPHAPYHHAQMLKAEHPEDAEVQQRAERLVKVAAERGFAPDGSAS